MYSTRYSICWNIYPRPHPTPSCWNYPQTIPRSVQILGSIWHLSYRKTRYRENWAKMICKGISIIFWSSPLQQARLGNRSPRSQNKPTFLLNFIIGERLAFNFSHCGFRHVLAWTNGSHFAVDIIWVVALHENDPGLLNNSLKFVSKDLK